MTAHLASPFKASLPDIRFGLRKAQMGIPGNNTERVFISLSEEEQQLMQRKLEANAEETNANTLIRESGHLKMPVVAFSKLTFLQDLRNFTALLKDEELKCPVKAAPQPTYHPSSNPNRSMTCKSQSLTPTR